MSTPEVFAPFARVIGHYGLIGVPNRIGVTDLRDKDADWEKYDVPNYGVDVYDLLRRKSLRIVQLEYPEDADGRADVVLVFLDPEDEGGFGYALNITDHSQSEWGVFGYLLSEDAGRAA